MKKFDSPINALKCNFFESAEGISLSRNQSIAISDLEPELVILSTQNLETGTIYGGIASAEKKSDENISSASPLHSSFRSSGVKPPFPIPDALDWSTSLQTLLDQPPSSLPKRLAIGGLLFCCVFGGWATFGKIQDVSHAQGRLIPQGEVYKIQPAVSGEVSKLRIREGQSVQTGEVIAELDDRLARAEVERLEQSLNANRLQLYQTQGLIRQMQLQVETRQAIATAAAQGKRAAIAQAQAKAATEQAMLPQLQSATSAYTARMERLQPLVDEGAIAQEHLFETEQALREHQQAMTQNEGALQQALAEANQLQAELTERQAEAQKTLLEAEQQLQQLQVEETQLQAKVEETEALIKSAKTRLKQMFLYAPVDGVVTSLHIRNTGEVAQVGQTLAEIAPAGHPLVLSAALPNQEAGLVRVGMPVQVKFDAFPYQDYGIAVGRIDSISPDAEVDQQLGAVYRIEVSLDEDSVTSDRQRIALRAGQTAKAEIVTRQRRIAEVLLDPIRKLQKSGANF